MIGGKEMKTIVTKWDRGRVIIVGGSRGAMFTVDIASRAALRGGAGLVVACVPNDTVTTLESRGGFYKVKGISTYNKEDSLDEILNLVFKSNCIIAGMGIEDDINCIFPFFSRMLAEISTPCVIDADLVNLIINHPEILMDRSNKEVPFVVTLNHYEACNIFDTLNPSDANAISLAKSFNTWIVLKGINTRIVSPNGEMKIHNSESIPEMAVAGMGDVLSGLIGSFIAQGQDFFSAITLALTIRKNAAKHYISKTADRIILPEDLIKCIPNVWESDRRK